jgi:hypothetical protein
MHRIPCRCRNSALRWVSPALAKPLGALRSIGEPDPLPSGPGPGDATWAKCGRLAGANKIPISLKSCSDSPNVSNGTSTGTGGRMSPYFDNEPVARAQQVLHESAQCLRSAV